MQDVGTSEREVWEGFKFFHSGATSRKGRSDALDRKRYHLSRVHIIQRDNPRMRLVRNVVSEETMRLVYNHVIETNLHHGK
jgi:hypothetical protein